MSGKDRIERNTGELLELRLILAHAEEHGGRRFTQHPLAREPDQVIVTAKTGRPSFLYATDDATLSYTLWGPPGDRRAQEVYTEGSLIKVRCYSPTGRILEEITDLNDGPRWEP